MGSVDEKKSLVYIRNSKLISMFKITILAVGKIKNKATGQLIDDYFKRLKVLAKIEMVELPAVSFTESKKAKAKIEEGKKILDYLSKHKSAKAVLLDERGKTFTSVKLADWLEDNGQVILVIGGSLGLSDEVKEIIKDKLALSALTLPHELARLILMEQLYRAATLIKGMDYHY